MVQGLAFLSKKSWHTKNLNNQEKVWIAEQRMAAEESKAKELAREVQQERDREEFDRLAGKKTHLDRGIDWMYQGQAATGDEPSAADQKDATKRAEDFLLGKEYAEEGSKQGDFTQGAESGGVNAAVKLEASVAFAAAVAAGASASSVAGVPSVADRNEAFRQRVEDPMFMVSQKEREQKKEANKQRSLYERVVGPVRSEGSTEDDNCDDSFDIKRKVSKHERKRERNERRRCQKDSRKTKRRRHQHHVHSSRDSNGSSDHERRERKQHDRASQRKDYKRHGFGHCHHRHHSHDSNNSIADLDRDHRQKRHRSGVSNDEKERTSRSSNDQIQNDRSRSRKRKKSRSLGDTRHRRHFDDNGCDQDQDRCPRVDGLRGRNYGSNREQGGTILKDGYGLQAKSTSACNLHSSSTDLGPDEDLLRRKREAAEESRRRAKERSSARCRITLAERAKALQEMQAVAQTRRTRDTFACELSDNDDGGHAQS